MTLSYTKAKELAVMNYGLMLNDVQMGLNDWTSVISRIMREGDLMEDKQLTHVGQLFGEFLMALKALDEELERIS